MCTLVMGTEPTDHLLANSDGTVGVRLNLYHNTPEWLKRDALPFDLITIPNLDHEVSRLAHSHPHVAEEEYWLRDSDIVWDGPKPDAEYLRFDHPKASRQYLNAMAAETAYDRAHYRDSRAR